MKKLIGIGVALVLVGGVLWIGGNVFAGEKEASSPEGQKPTVSSSETPAKAAETPGKAADAPGHAHEKAALHGGTVAMTKNHHFETAIAPDGIRVYAYTAQQAPMMVDKAKGTVSLVSKAGTKTDVALVRTEPAEGEPAVYFCPMHAEVVQKEPGLCQLCGGMKLYKQDYLYGKADLSKVDPASTKLIVLLTELPGDEKSVTFTQGFQMAGSKPAATPAAPEAGKETGKEPAEGGTKESGEGHEGHDH